MILIILAVALLIFCSAFFSSSEIVFASANRPRLKSAAEDGDRRARTALEIIEDYVRAISTILVGNDLVNIAAASLITLLCVNDLFPGHPRAQLYAEIIATLVLLIFGEIMPKLNAAEHPNRLALRYAGPMRLAMTVFKPVVFVVTKIVEALSPLWTPKEAEPSITDEELTLVVDSIQEEGVISQEESELIKSAIEFRDITARDILIPRVEIVACDLEDDPALILQNPDALSFSRLPVYRGSIDTIVGILPVKQLMKAVLTGEEADIESMLLPAMFVHMTKNVGDILSEMRETQQHMAVVLDEYGGTMGILTLEDILEEIVGEIYDETDEVEPEEVIEIREDIFELDGSMNLEDAFDEMEYTPKDLNTEYSTLSGWITGMLDRFPAEGDTFSFEALTVTVLSVDGRLAERVRVAVGRGE